MTPRLTSSMLVSALIRQVDGAGGAAAVLAKGDGVSGSILLILAEKGVVSSVRERLLGIDGAYHWESIGPDDAEARNDYLARRRARDPDLWLVELDIPQVERFVAETTAGG